MPVGSVSIEDLATGLRDGMTVKRVFGDAYEKDGVTVIPVAKVGGGGGAGGGGTETEGGSGGAFGLGAQPVGVYVIRGGEVSWKPALDVNRIIGSATTSLVAFLLITRSIFKRRARRSERLAAMKRK
jgi:uncharacterized spore protein YtfJ